MLIRLYNESLELKTEIKVINHILTDKFEKLNIVGNAGNEKHEPKEPYADKLKKTATKEASHKIIIKEKHNEDSDKTKTEMKKSHRSYQEIGINGVTKIKNGKIEITVPTKTDIEKIKETLNKQENLEVEERKRNRSRLILEDVPNDIKEEKELLDTIWQQNETICNIYSRQTINKLKSEYT